MAVWSPTIFTPEYTIVRAGTTVNLSWSQASGALIIGYDLAYCDSADNANWGAWSAETRVSVALNATSGSSLMNVNAIQGYCRKYRIRTVGSMNGGEVSSWAESTSVRTNIQPGAPSSFTANPAIYFNSTLTLTWGFSTGGTSPVFRYNLSYRTSDDGGSVWTGWSVVADYGASIRAASVSPPTLLRRQVQYRLRATDTLGSTSDYVYVTVTCEFSKASAPTTLTVSATVSESDVMLSWSGAGSGTGGPISGYPIEYGDSADGITWGAWTSLRFYSTQSTGSSIAVSPPAIRGDYRRFRIRTEPSTGEEYSSDWRVSSNSLRRNTLPSPPAAFTASPPTYPTGGSVTLTWSGTVAGTSTVKNYVIQYSISSNGKTYSGYSALATVPTSSASGSYIHTPRYADRYTRYRILTTDALDCVSEYVVSNVVIRNLPPPSPTVSAPKNGAITYNTQPRVLITLGTEPDGERQMLCVKTADGAWLDSVSNPGNFSVSGWLGDNVSVTFHHDSLTPGTYSISVKAKDESVQAESGELSCSFTVAASPFTEIIPNETPVKAEQINTLRIAVNNVHNYYGMSAYAWREEVIPGRTQIKNWPSHITELRRAVDEIISTFDLPPVEWIPIEIVRPQAAVMNQLQNILLSL